MPYMSETCLLGLFKGAGTESCQVSALRASLPKDGEYSQCINYFLPLQIKTIYDKNTSITIKPISSLSSSTFFTHLPNPNPKINSKKPRPHKTSFPLFFFVFVEYVHEVNATVACYLLQQQKMSRCEHGQKITKFCITEHCHHKQAAGCDYCIKKYHFHLTNTTLLSQTDIEAVVKMLTFPSDGKYKSKALQDLANDYLRQVKQAFNGWVEQAQNIISEKLSNPLLRKQGLLPTYQRIRNRDFRKINAKDLKAIHQFTKNGQPDNLKKEEVQAYFSEVEWVGSIVNATEAIAKQLSKLPILKESEPVSVQKGNKLIETYESIIREKERCFGLAKQSEKESEPFKLETNKLDEITKSSSLMKNRLTRELSQKEKSATPNKDIVSDAIGRKLQVEVPGKASSIVPVTLFEPKVENQEKFGNETTQERNKRLRRRRSSIDEGIDMKFGLVDRDKEFKDIQLRKKQILQTIFSSRQNQKEKQEAKKEEVRSKTTEEELKKVENSITDSKESSNTAFYGSVKTERSSNNDKMGESINNEDYRSQASSNKASEQNIFQTLFQKGGINVAELINSLIPAPPVINKTEHENQTVTNKVYKVPIPTNSTNSHYFEEIQSPIFKNKRRMDKQNTTGFGIALNVVDTIKQEDVPLPEVKEELKEETETLIPRKNSSVKEEENNEVIVLEKNDKNSLLLFCEALKSDSDKAIELLKAALKYSPNNLSAAEYLSYLYLDNQRAKECLEVCEAILLKIQDKAQEFQVTLHLHNNRAAALNKLGRYSQSIVVLQKCLKYRRKHYFYKNLADAYFSLGIPQKAAMNYEKAIRLDPTYDEAFYNLAVTQFLQQEYTSAKLNIQQAVKIDPNSQAYQELDKQISSRIENIMK